VPSLVVSVSDGRGRRVNGRGLARWLASVAPRRVRGEVGVALVTDAHIRKLNAQYRRQNVPTDVLSFPSDPPLRGPEGVLSVSKDASGIPDRGARASLGDIVIASGVARRQARDAGHSYTTELRVLALHGLLHLLGYDHERREDRGRMARAEARLRAKGGLSVGLIERASVVPASRAATRK
jgi:probable rRNA maturation factor